ncbi:MAG: DUF3105 domain-containing protein [Chloroflexota bacterium]
MAKRIKSTKKRKSEKSSTSTRNKVKMWAGLALGIIALGYLLFLSLRGPSSIQDIVRHYGEERGHDNSVVYEGDIPPTGGLHSEVWQNCGIYDEAIEAANAIHSMEHGAVWITYQPDLSAGDIEILQNQVRGEPYLLLSPFPGQRSPVVLTAWEIQLELDSVKDGRLQTFINRYPQGVTTPERGASCQDGIGTPLQ